jgi:hypothetical protein
MEEDKKIMTRDELKKYFETGARPTEAQFTELIDSYAHLNEFNFGLSVKPSGGTAKKYYHFYKADDVKNSGAGHKTVGVSKGSKPQYIDGYSHILSRNVLYKSLDIKLIGAIDIAKHQPKIIIERYKQRKKMPSGFLKSAGFYKENTWDAAQWNRKSEYSVNANEMVLDIEPIHYFKPHASFKEFSPSGSINRPGSFKYSRHSKPFVPIQLKLQIHIDGIAYTSQPVGLKIILGSSGESDAINFVFN